MIFCVVYWHCSIYTGTTDSPVNNFFLPFYLTLFFFINGFFSYIKPGKQMQWKHAITKRLQSLFVPSIVMCILFSLYNGYSSDEVAYNDMKGGYWFTIVAFFIYLIFISIECIARLTRNKQKLILYGSIILLFSLPSLIGHRWDNNPIYRLFSTYQIIKYLPFFYTGVISHMYRDKFYKLVSNDWIICLFIVLMIGLYIFHNRLSVWVQGYLGIFIICAIFFKFRKIFDSDNSIINMILIIGRNTLAIYFLHYFCLGGISALSPLAQNIMSNGSWLLNATLTSSIALTIIGLCILAKRCISTSNILNKLMFG